MSRPASGAAATPSANGPRPWWRSRATDAACVAILAALTLLFFWRTLFTDAILLPTDLVLRLQPWRAYSRHLFPEFERVYNPLLDPILEFGPWRVWTANILAGGHLPLWNPHAFSGQPFLANVLSAVLYPPNALFCLMQPTRAFAAVAALHIFLGGTFTYLFLRVLRLRPLSAILGAVVFMFCGFHVVWLEWQTLVAAAIWLPLALAFWERFARGDGARFACYTAFPLGMSLLAGHLQIAAYVLLAFLCYAVWRSGARPSRWLAAGAALALGIALAGAQVLPSLELGRYSHRAGGLTLETVLQTALPVKHLITFLVPNFFGNIVDYNYWSTSNYIEFCGYLGVLPLLLAFIAPWLRRDGHTRFFAVLAVFSILMVLGTPLYGIVYHIIPGFKQLSAPARMLGVFSLSIACLSAFAAEALADLPAPRRKGLLLGIGGLLLLACASVSLTHTRFADEIAGFGLQDYVAAQAAVFFLLALAAAAVIVAAAGRPRALWLLPVLAAADLLFFGMRFNPAGDPRMLYFPTETLSYLRAQPGPFRVLSLPGPGNDFMNSMIPNANMSAPVSEVQGSDSVYPGRYREFADFVETLQQGKPVGHGNGLKFAAPDVPGLNFLNVLYVLSAKEVQHPQLEHVASMDIHLYRNRAAAPRAFLVHNARVEAPARVLPAMAEERFALDRIALLEQESPLPLAPAAGAESVSVTRYQENKVTLSVTASGNALLILADQYFPGWRATVDGKPVDVLAANYIMRAVPVSAGQHTVEFTYQPTAFRAGLYLSLMALAVLLAVATATFVSRRTVAALRA